MNLLDRLFRRRRQRKEERRLEMMRINSPACPRCGKSTVDMDRKCFIRSEPWGAQLRCDGCGLRTHWNDTGFMGIMYPANIKEYLAERMLYR